jgi:hypothetical protein
MASAKASPQRVSAPSIRLLTASSLMRSLSKSNRKADPSLATKSK